MIKPIRWVCTLSAALLAVCSWAQSKGKKVVNSDNDLPRFVYPVKGSASALLEADDASFNIFAAKVRTDLDSILEDYDIPDKATMRTLLRTELELQMLAGQYTAALDTVDRCVRSKKSHPPS